MTARETDLCRSAALADRRSERALDLVSCFEGESGARGAEGRADDVRAGERFGVHPTMIHQGKKALLGGASELFERGSSAKEPAIDEARVEALHVKIGELTVTNDFFVRKARPWTGK